jgi:hypothetical protein
MERWKSGKNRESEAANIQRMPIFEQLSPHWPVVSIGLRWLRVTHHRPALDTHTADKPVAGKRGTYGERRFY